MVKHQPQQNHYNNIFNLKNRVSVVTGAGHIGSEIAKALSDFGSCVFVLTRSPVKYASLSKYKNITLMECDVTDEIKVYECIKEIRDSLVNIDILVNNAFSEKREDILKVTKQEWDSGLNTMLSHVFFCSQAVLPNMLERGSGSIINISSIYGVVGHDQSVFQEVKSSSIMYSVAKGGVLQLTKRLATEYASQGIRVNCVSPGHFPKKSPGSPDRPGYIVSLSERTPMKRVGQPHELPGAVVYLASDASSYTTGQNILVDGGWSVW
tara:strand:+ start:794 stop:1591 length:798 start_codon:yes stop_codon:yes gene_type:complete